MLIFSMDTIDVNSESHAISPPNRVLGYVIRSRTRIYISYIIPAVFATFVYIVQFIADCAVSYEHFHNHQPEIGAATLSLVLIPPFLNLILVFSSKAQRENPKHPSRLHFFGYHVLQTIFFPFFALNRFAVRIFWSIEALFQKNNDAERMLCLEKSAECATCELYLFIQAYAQAAPQIILQMYHMLNQDLFRDYQTTTAQAICLVFSAIDLASVTTSYQRFESQYRVGRPCPWSAPQQLKAQRVLLECNSRLRNECSRHRNASERSLLHFPASDVIMKKFECQNELTKIEKNTPKHTVQLHSNDEIDNDDEEFDPSEAKGLTHSCSNEKTLNATDDDKIRSNPKLHIPTIKNHVQIEELDEITILDTVPDTPPPPLPTNRRTQECQTDDLEFSRNTFTNKRTSNTFSQLETFKDMLIVNAQLYIKDHLPHPPKVFIKRIETCDVEDKLRYKTHPPPSSPSDETDFFLSRPTRIINGIQQEDFAAKTIAFFGWICYISMRMLALATFCSFYPKPFFILVLVHYGIMLFALCLESRFKGKANIFLFYPILAYVFLFVLLEFRVHFQRIRIWILGYFLITMGENIVMTALWYIKEDFESWWVDFIAESITYSGGLFVATLIVYYYLLKPKDVILIVEDEDSNG